MAGEEFADVALGNAVRYRHAQSAAAGLDAQRQARGAQIPPYGERQGPAIDVDLAPFRLRRGLQGLAGLSNQGEHAAFHSRFEGR